MTVGCNRCTRCKSRTNVVRPEIAYTGERPDVLILGESPSQEEDVLGKPFVGVCGVKVLRPILKACSNVNSWVMDNSVRCFGGSKPNDKQLSACSFNWKRTVLKHDPKMIVALGRYATAAVLEYKPKDMASVVGVATRVKIGDKYYPVVINYHPAFILKTTDQKGGANEKALKSWYDTWDLIDDTVGKGFFTPPDTKLIVKPADVYKLFSRLRKKPIFAYDYETSGDRDARRPELCSKFKILSVGIGCDEGGFAFSFDNQYVPEWCRLLRTGDTVTHYSKYEHKCNLKVFGETWPCDDTAVGMNTINELSSAKLGSVGHYYKVPWCGYKLDMIHVGEKPEDFDLQTLLKYNSLDGLMTYEVWQKMRNDLVRLHVPYKHGIEFSRHLAHVEMDGMYVDRSLVGTVRKETKFQINEAVSKLRSHEAVKKTEKWSIEHVKSFKEGDAYNPKSPKQTDYLCSKALKLVKPFMFIYGKMSVEKGWDKKVLAMFDDNPVVRDLLLVRSLSSMQTGFLEKWNNFMGPDGCCHSLFNQDVTVTGRLSSTEPNLQNIPARSLIKKVFTSRWGDDGVILAFDYKQLEPRLLAGWSGDEQMVDALNGGLDLHRFVAGQIFNVDYKNVTDKQRNIGKRRNLGSMYGQTAAGLAAMTNISMEAAQEIVDIYNRRFRGAYEWRMKKQQEAIKYGKVSDLFGAERHLKDAQSANKSKANRALRQASNYPIQSTGNRFCLIALCWTRDSLSEAFYSAKVIGTTHDSLYVDSKKKDMYEVAKLTVECMKKHNNMDYWRDKPVKMEVDSKCGPNLLSLKPININ